MTVYLEYAFAENFLLDGLLLYLSLKCARAKVGPFRLAFAAAIGGGESLAFPLFSLPIWAAYCVKFFGGALLALIAVSKENAKTVLIVVAVFFALTFTFGGVLVAVYSFFNIPYVEGEGYLVEGAPVSLVLASAGCFFVIACKAIGFFYRYRKVKKSVVGCRLTVGGKTVRWKGFPDSGNCLLFRGKPVCVVSAVAALALFRETKPLGRMTISTVNGNRTAPVFGCERLEITCDGETFVQKNARFTVGEVESKDYQIILHTAYMEGHHENFGGIEGMVEEARGL